MMERFIAGVLEREGGYVDHPSDPGGATNWGITQRVARANGYNGHMRDLPKATAIDIYRREYIEKPGFDKIAAIDETVAEKLIDAGVNAGTQRAGQWFQQSLNTLNRRQVDFGDVTEDGKIGPRTIAAFNALRAKRGPAAARSLMMKCLNGLQFGHYYSLAKNNAKFEDFFVGWISSRIF